MQVVFRIVFLGSKVFSALPNGFSKSMTRRRRAQLIIVGLCAGICVTLMAAYFAVQVVRTPPKLGSVDAWRLNLSEFRTLGLTQRDDAHFSVRIVAKKWMFDIGQPRDQAVRITIPAGSELEIIATSMDVAHSLAIPGYPTLYISPGRTSRLTVSFAQAGEYTFVCSVYCGPNHQAMQGTILVTP
jgi:heme/copper-type cytochrome/quinol oxidase subunit 2